MVDIGRGKDALIYEAMLIAGGSLIAATVWFCSTSLGYTNAITPLVSVGSSLMMTVMYDNKKLSADPSAKTCTYEGLACGIYFGAIFAGMGMGSGPTAPKSIMDILTCAIGMASVIALTRFIYFAIILSWKMEIPQL